MWAPPDSTASWRQKAQQRNVDSERQCFRVSRDTSIICLQGDTSSRSGFAYDPMETSEYVLAPPPEYVPCITRPMQHGTVTVYDNHASKCVTHASEALRACEDGGHEAGACRRSVRQHTRELRMCARRNGDVAVMDAAHPEVCAARDAVQAFTCRSAADVDNVALTRCVERFSYTDKDVTYDPSAGTCATLSAGALPSDESASTVCTPRRTT